MANCKVTIMVQSINVVSNGDVPGSGPRHTTGKKNNAVTASLTYPWGGVPQMCSVIQADLKSNAACPFDTSNFFGPKGDGINAPGLFKGEEIEDSSPLKIQVTTNEDAGQLSSLLGKVLSGLLGAAVKLAPGGQVVGAVLGAVVGGVGDLVTHETNGSTEVIGEATLSLDAASLLAGGNSVNMALPLVAPKTINKSWVVLEVPPGGGPAQEVTHSADLTTQGQSNGTINLLINVSPA